MPDARPLHTARAESRFEILEQSVRLEVVRYTRTKQTRPKYRCPIRLAYQRDQRKPQSQESVGCCAQPSSGVALSCYLERPCGSLKSPPITGAQVPSSRKEARRGDSVAAARESPTSRSLLPSDINQQCPQYLVFYANRSIVAAH